MEDPIVMVAAKRTPIGMMMGQLSSMTAPQLAAVVLKGLIPAGLHSVN